MWPGGRVLSAGIVWFLHMHSRNRMMARLEVTLRTRNIHVVYFHSWPSVGPDFSLRYVNAKQTHKTQFYTNGNLELENSGYSPASSAIHVVERRTINHLKLKLK